MKYLLLLSLFLSTSLCNLLHAQKEIMQTEIKHHLIHSLFVRNTGDWMKPPILSPKEEESIQISFDEFSLDYRNVYYEIYYCNADWSLSSLNELDYLAGFNKQPLTDYTTSFNTRMDYTHYSLTLPNEEVQFKLSGNYCVRFYDYDTDEELVYACFSVSEDKITVDAKVLFDTDKSFRDEYQQVEFEIHNPRYPITNPHNELYVTVEQNRRRDNATSDLRPTYIQNDKITYQHNKNLIFEAGNEFRRFEMITTQYTGMGIERIDFRPPYYHVELQLPVSERPGTAYTFTKDLNGRTFIRHDESTQSEIEADYFMVHFDLPISPIPQKGALYIFGEFTNYKFNDFCKMQYSDESKSYHAVLPLKEGVYDYAFLFVPEGKNIATMRYTEGNYYETENEYLIKVYHRPSGSRYDKLIGYVVVNAN